MTIARVLVVDDEPLARDELAFLLGQCGSCMVKEAANAEEALALCATQDFDIAFVDLRMPGPDGLALAEAFSERCPGLRVVVVSAHDDGALAAFEAQVFDYLLKPVRLSRLQKTLERVQAHQARGAFKAGAKSLERIAVRRGGVFVVLDVRDVIVFEMRDELVWAVTERDRFALDLTLQSVEAGVPTEVFFRSHRGCLVRLDKIRAIEPAGAGTFELLLSHPENLRVPLARDRARLLREKIPFAG